MGLYRGKFEYAMPGEEGLYRMEYVFYFDFFTGEPICHSIAGYALHYYDNRGQLYKQYYYIDGDNVRPENFFEEVCRYMSKVRCPVCRGDVTDVISLNTEDKEITCPRCGQSSPLELWKEAYDNPANFFDTLQLCDCGGEIWHTISPGDSKGRLVCDRCGKEFPLPDKPKVGPIFFIDFKAEGLM